MVKKKEPAKSTVKEQKEPEVNATHLDELWEVINEMQNNLNFLNEKVERLLSRMGLE